MMRKHLRRQEGIILRKGPIIKNKQKLNTSVQSLNRMRNTPIK